MIADLIERVCPSVVPVAYFVDSAPDESNRGPVPHVAGTGFVVDDNGLVATCAHVLGKPATEKQLVVGLRHNSTMAWYAAETVAVVGEPLLNIEEIRYPDVGLIRIQPKQACAVGAKRDGKVVLADGRPAVSGTTMMECDARQVEVPPLMLGTAKKLRAGDEVVFMGYPMGGSAGEPMEWAQEWHPSFGKVFSSLGLCPSATRSIISAVRTAKVFGVADCRVEQFHLLELDSPCNPGNSGGPVLSLISGEVVGFIAFHTPALPGTSFAYPIDLVRRVMAGLQP